MYSWRKKIEGVTTKAHQRFNVCCRHSKAAGTHARAVILHCAAECTAPKTIAYRAHARSAACEHKHMQLKDCRADS